MIWFGWVGLGSVGRAILDGLVGWGPGFRDGMKGVYMMVLHDVAFLRTRSGTEFICSLKFKLP